MTNKIEIIRSKRRTIAVEVKSDLRVIVRAPLKMTDKDIHRFLAQKSAWIEKHLEIAKERQDERLTSFNDAEIKELAEAAKQDLPQRVERFAAIMGVTVGRIAIRKQKTRWGSCSAKGNLNFNCLLMLCHPDVRDYVVVHELCHRLELNHSPRFWALVEQILPNYKKQREWLKNNSNVLINSISTGKETKHG